MKLLLSVLLLLGTLSLTACGGSDASGSADDPTAAFVGTWQIDGFDITAHFNSDGRVQMNMPDGTACVGDYRVSDGRLSIDYDEGQSNCMSMGASYAFEADDVLKIGPSTTYRRLDTNDKRPI
jgi:major membrane immunogen (membrane-anchored lipoprotein)